MGLWYIRRALPTPLYIPYTAVISFAINKLTPNNKQWYQNSCNIIQQNYSIFLSTHLRVSWLFPYFVFIFRPSFGAEISRVSCSQWQWHLTTRTNREAYKMCDKLKHKIVKSEAKPDKVTAVALHVDEDCPDGGYGWIICMAAAIIQFIILGIHNNFGILYTSLISDLHFKPSDAGKNFNFQRFTGELTD